MSHVAWELDLNVSGYLLDRSTRKIKPKFITFRRYPMTLPRAVVTVGASNRLYIIQWAPFVRSPTMMATAHLPTHAGNGFNPEVAGPALDVPNAVPECIGVGVEAVGTLLRLASASCTQ